MNLQLIDNIFTFSAGALVCVESAILLVGMNLPRPSSWSSPLNVAFAVSDIIIGGCLVYVSLSGTSYNVNLLFFIGIGILILTHGFRTVQYLIPDSNPFTANLPLFIFNNVRLLLLGTSFGISLSFLL